MKCMYLAGFALVVAMALPAPTEAQGTTATVNISLPVDLSQLGPDVVKVRIRCQLGSSALMTPREQTRDLQVFGGKVQNTVSFSFYLTNLNKPVGKSAYVTCYVNGLSQSRGTYEMFGPQNPFPDFQTDVAVAPVQTTWTW